MRATISLKTERLADLEGNVDHTGELHTLCCSAPESGNDNNVKSNRETITYILREASGTNGLSIEFTRFENQLDRLRGRRNYKKENQCKRKGFVTEYSWKESMVEEMTIKFSTSDFVDSTLAVLRGAS